MNKNALMQIPGYAEARYKEHLSRAAALLCESVPVCGFWLRHLTPRTLAELELAGNACVIGRGEPDERECADFLWRHSVHFRRPGCVGLRGWLEHRRIKRYVRKLGAAAIAAEIRAFLGMGRQDAYTPLDSGGKEGARVQAAHWCISCASFYHAVCGMTLDAYLDTPMNVLDQQFRVWLMREGRGHEIDNESEHILARHVSRVLEAAGKNKGGR